MTMRIHCVVMGRCGGGAQFLFSLFWPRRGEGEVEESTVEQSTVEQSTVEQSTVEQSTVEQSTAQ